MADTVVNIITDISRFWFLLITLYILIRLIDNSLSEYAFRKQMLNYGPGDFWRIGGASPADTKGN
ncbi:MAG: hypothetical protein ACLT0Y_04720 [Christensenellales bacterium]